MPRILQLTRSDNSGVTTWIDLNLSESEDVAWMNRQDLPAHLLEHLRRQVDFSRREFIDDGLLICFQNHQERSSIRKQPAPSMRLWIEKDRVITLRSDVSADCDALFEAARANSDSWSPYQIVSFLLRNNLTRLEAFISELVGRVGDLEDQFVDDEDEFANEALSRVGREMMRTRRHLIEQRDLLKFVLIDDSLTINELERRALGSAQDHVQSYLAGLDDCRERLLLLQNQVDARRGDRFNLNAQRMTVLATVFLPLSFLTGLLGMNVAGIPDEHSPYGFAVVCVGMIVIAVVFWLFLTRRWT